MKLLWILPLIILFISGNVMGLETHDGGIEPSICAEKEKTRNLVIQVPGCIFSLQEHQYLEALEKRTQGKRLLLVSLPFALVGIGLMGAAAIVNDNDYHGAKLEEKGDNYGVTLGLNIGGAVSIFAAFMFYMTGFTKYLEGARVTKLFEMCPKRNAAAIEVLPLMDPRSKTGGLALSVTL